MKTPIERLSNWFAKHCDGKWEHRAGIRLETCDNPGWWLKVNLKDTDLESRPFPRHAEGVGEDHFQTADDWIDCYVKDTEFNGAGSLNRLEEILTVFLNWAETDGRGDA